MAIKREIREQVYNKYNGHCAYCGKEIEYKDMQVDHIIPQHLFNESNELLGVQKDEIGNLMPACRRCNHYKRGNSLEGFRRLISEIPIKLERDSYIYKVGLDYGFYEQPEVKEIRFYFEKI